MHGVTRRTSFSHPGARKITKNIFTAAYMLSPSAITKESVRFKLMERASSVSILWSASHFPIWSTACNTLYAMNLMNVTNIWTALISHGWSGGLGVDIRSNICGKDKKTTTYSSQKWQWSENHITPREHVNIPSDISVIHRSGIRLHLLLSLNCSWSLPSRRPSLAWRSNFIHNILTSIRKTLVYHSSGRSDEWRYS